MSKISEDKIIKIIGDKFEKFLENLDFNYLIQIFLENFDLERVLKDIFHRSNEKLKELMKEQIEQIIKEEMSKK